MKQWLVGGAVIEGEGGYLLVQNRRRNGRADWSPPGGVIDAGESVIEGLTREVAEETGLVVAAWEGPVYEIEAHAPDMGWTLRVQVHRAVGIEGPLVLEDPDGIVIDACYLQPDACSARLASAPRWVREPFEAWMTTSCEAQRVFGYRIEGTDLASLRVHAVTT